MRANEPSGRRPTAVNLRWALDGMAARCANAARRRAASAAYARAAQICDTDVETSRTIGATGWR